MGEQINLFRSGIGTLLVKIMEKQVIDTIAVLDFGSQYAQLIVRRIRDAKVYAALFPWDAPQEKVMVEKPKGFVLSGGPSSVYDPGAPRIPGYVLESGLPILGICYGMHEFSSC